MKLPQPPRKDDLRFDDWCNLLQKHVAGLTPDNLNISSLGDYSNDANAAAGGVLVGALYRNGSVLMVRVS